MRLMKKITRTLLRRFVSLRRHWRKRREVRLGLAIAPERIVAVELKRSLRGLSPGRVQARPLESPAEDGSWPDLAEALNDLLATFGARRGTASIALLHPLANAKVITVPPVRRRDLRPLVARNLRRYFITGADPAVVDAAPLRRSRREPALAMATCADARRVQAIHAAVRAAGLRLESIVAAPLAVTEAVCELLPAARRRELVIALHSPEWCEGIAVSHGTVRLVAPWNGADDEHVPQLVMRLAEAGFGAAGPGAELASVALAPAEQRERISAALSLEIGQAPLDGPGLDQLEPAALAAYGAALMPESAPQLLPAEPRRARQRRLNIRVAALSAAAVVVLCVAAALHLWGLKREVEAVSAERSAHAVDVARALEQRQTADAVRARLETIARIEQAALPWTPAVAELAEALPDSAYLVSFSAEGLQLRLAGVAKSASSIVPALEASPLLGQVSLTAARRSDGGGDAESFDLALALESEPEAAEQSGPSEGGSR